jgi:hypothetical protein
MRCLVAAMRLGQLSQPLATAIAAARIAATCCVMVESLQAAYVAGPRARRDPPSLLQVITLTDACAATSQEAHDAAVTHTFPMFSQPMTVRGPLREAGLGDWGVGARIESTSRGASAL